MPKDEALSQLYRDAYGFVLAKAHAIVQNRADAKEVAQETFVRAHQNWRKVSRHPSPLGWLLTTTARLAIDRRRKKETARRGAVELARPPADSPAASVEAAEILRAVLSESQDRTRQVVLHIHLDGMTQEETAMVLQISRKSVQRHLAKFQKRCDAFCRAHPEVTHG